MNIGAQLAFPGAVLGSFIVAMFGFMMTSNVKAEALPTPPAPLVQTAAGLVDASQPTPEPQPTQPASPEALFEAMIAYTPGGSESDPASPAGAGCEVSDRFPPGILQWCEFITRYSVQYDLPPNLIAAVMLQESGGQALAYSHSGAVGLMQVMPKDGIATKFMCKNGPCFTNRPSIAELQDPEFNVYYGVKMLSGLVNRFGNYRDGLKSYGPMDVGYSYADKVLAIYQRYGN
jgi:hypothetical protein